MEIRHTVEVAGEVYDPDTLTVGELKKFGVNPLAGASDAQILAMLLARDYTDDEIEAFLNRDSLDSVMEVRVTVPSRPGEVPDVG